jgi:hypothetical protein
MAQQPANNSNLLMHRVIVAPSPGVIASVARPEIHQRSS